MDLPDCPPGAEGYQDSVTEVPKKPEDSTCTKAEQEFQDHLNSLKIKIEDGNYRCMVERRGRDVSGKWIYLCYPCAAVCSGEAILQTHISGKKHKTKLSMKNVWPLSIFDEHPYNQSENGNKIAATPNVLKKMAEEVELFNKSTSDMDKKYGRLKDVRCHIQDTLDEVTAPLIGVEYLVEHPPLESHYEPSYTCTLCYKQGHPRTIVNHMTCFWHRHNYLQRHFPKAADLLKPFRQQIKYRDGVVFIMNRIAHRIVEKYGRMNPINIDKEDYDKEKERIHQWIFKGPHYAETKDCTFEEVVDIDLINTLYKSGTNKPAIKDPSPPIVAAPKPNYSNRAPERRERRVSMESLSDLSDELERFVRKTAVEDNSKRGNQTQPLKGRLESYPDKGRDASNQRGKYVLKNATKNALTTKTTTKPNYEYKLQLAADNCKVAEDAASKSLAYHEKNPEKHPLYPEEWKKFWNRRYKEIQGEGKDPSKHDFKPEWIVFWTGRMKELHKEELRLQVVEIYRKLCVTPPPPQSSPPPDKRRKTPEQKDVRRRSPDHKDRKRTLDPRRKSPLPFRLGPDGRRRSPEPRRRSPEPRRRSPEPRRRSPDLRRRSPDPRRYSPHYRRDHRSPFPHRRSPPRRHSPIRAMRTRSRSPMRSLRSPARTHIVLDSRGSRSPLSRRETLRNRSPGARNRSPAPRIRSPVPRNRSPIHRTRSPILVRHSPGRSRSPVRIRSPMSHNRASESGRSELQLHSSGRNRSPAPVVLNTVLISDDELKPEDAASPWNSNDSLESLGSLPDARSPRPSPSHSRTGSVLSRHRAEQRDSGADNVVGTLRTLVALEDYLGSLGPKIVDLLAEAIKMEKEKANSSEELLERETAVVLIETAKEKLKGAAQAGLVAPAATAAVRSAVVRAAATLHEADKRARQLKAEKAESSMKAASVPVAGVGAVDRMQIAQQMAAALVAQGKTDVSEEELAQLVDAVVGMAEAKKREADEKKQAAVKSVYSELGADGVSGTASALQMLQSAYDDKKCDREDAPDAMDGLSDSDLETLLKNFNELSAEEQHSLIAYLKKLEAREPQRVERLRQYVSAAAAHAPVRTPHTALSHNPVVAAPAPAAAPTSAPASDTLPVAIESDDDDYTVEEVFKCVSEKVKEDKIRQEMEIVKKSLEESKVSASEVTADECLPPAVSTKPDFNRNISSATSLLALMQASLQFANKPVLNAAAPVADVVTSNTQPRSFGDKPEAANSMSHVNTSQPTYGAHLQNQPSFNQQGATHVSPNITYMNTPDMSNESRLAGGIPNINNEIRLGGNNLNLQSEPRFGGNKPNVHGEQMFGPHNPNIQNQPRFAGNNANLHSEQGYGGNNPNALIAANNPRMHIEQPYGGGNSNMYNETPYKGPAWEPRQLPNVPIGPMRDQGFNNYPQDNSYKQADRGPPDMFNQRPQPGNFNINPGRMQEKFDSRAQNTNQQHYGNYDHSSQRGRGGMMGNFGIRGRGRGRGTW